MYQQVIDIITTEHDWKAIVVELAKTHPEILIQLVSKLKMTGHNPAIYGMDINQQIINKIIETLTTLGKVSAIKQYREITGARLTTAKVDVETIMEQYNVIPKQT